MAIKRELCQRSTVLISESMVAVPMYQMQNVDAVFEVRYLTTACEVDQH